MRDEELLIVFALVALIALLPAILYLLTLQNILKEVRPENRVMPPGQVWLVLIPLFGTVWHFIVVGKVADSLANEFSARGLTPAEVRSGYSIGLTFLILGLCGIVPILGVLASIGALVCWIIYWSKIAGYKRQLGTLSGTLDERI